MSSVTGYDESLGQTLWNVLPGIIKTIAILSLISLPFIGFNLLSRGNTSVPFVYQQGLQRPENPTMGNSSSQVKVVYFIDYQCPACAANAPVMKQVKEEYKDKILFVYKHYPIREIHIYAEQSARAVQAASMQGKAFEYGDLVFANQSQGLSNSNLEKWARDVGLDINKWNTDRGSRDVQNLVEFDRKDLNETSLPKSSVSGEAKNSGQGAGTPTFIILKDGTAVDWWTGSLPVDQVRTKLDEQLK